MKNRFMQTAGGKLIGLMMLFGVTQILVSGQESESARPNETSSHSNQSIEGVWQTEITLRVCQTGAVIRTFRGINTFHEGGTISETSNALSPALRSSGHGVWEREGRSTFTGSFIFQRFNPDGTFAGTQKTTITNVLTGRFGNTYDSTASIEIFDPNNNLVGTGCATAVGTRY